jgi:hypothetical protein
MLPKTPLKKGLYRVFCGQKRVFCTFQTKLNGNSDGRICSISPNTIVEYEQRLLSAGLSWPLPGHLDDQASAAYRYHPHY